MPSAVGALWGCTPQKDHILRVSEADLKINFSSIEVTSVVTVSVCARSPSAFVMRTYEDMTLDNLSVGTLVGSQILPSLQ